MAILGIYLILYKLYASQSVSGARIFQHQGGGQRAELRKDRNAAARTGAFGPLTHFWENFSWRLQGGFLKYLGKLW